MPIHNADIARLFHRVADLLEISTANPFRVRAYRNAARTLTDQTQSAAQLLEDGADLSDLPDIGQDLAGKIVEILETGQLGLLKDLEKKIPGDLVDLLDIAQLGPKRVAALYHELDIHNLDDLAKAARAQKIRDLEGFGEKLEKKILKEIERQTGSEGRTKRAAAEEVVGPLLAYLEKIDGVKRVIVAGSYRRRQETVGDLDILVTCSQDSAVMERFVSFEDVDEVLANGTTRSSVRLRGGLQVDLRVVAEVSYGAALYYFTGSKEHNIALRKIAVDKGLKINEYGVFQGKGDDEERIAGATEEEVLAAVDLPYIPPELRENRGEIEAAQKSKLPALIEGDDICGDLHAHTRGTDGRGTLKEMVEAARELGYSYLAITEHSQAVKVAKGFDRRRLQEQIEKIDELTDNYAGFRILKGIEVDILEDGSLDLPDDVLDQLDLTICSIHSHFNLSSEKQTERIIRAMDNPHFNILGHPSGRLINERAPYPLNMEKIMHAALERGCYLELNAHPDRLDLNDHHCRMAKDLGLKLAIATDAHSVQGLQNMKYGIDQARRGWLGKEDVINTRRTAELLRLLKR
ncbi:DNA polymerase/3'-5' exonuclease PolX [Desulfuromonas sp. AOP6]|uniref:DNA polymerase/3'-5' exonuclease PolX n=1 Tax=Desulfuromonas sp. AOP6 TaxID=1566351 RepID=UPI00126C545F|nr:DNA polymerase/3'-5' exonuclease PolX [Desulfuromonas sp. AOP6]BCA79935.1 DNA polymerase/3'-5' exonuclease PolX [Desulfuromonas sp. AOP6]